MSQNYIDALIDHVSRHLAELQKLSPEQIEALIVELKNETNVWNELPAGNREYLENALRWKTEKGFKGAIPHLVAALPHRLGFIAAVTKQQEGIGDPTFDDIITGKRKLTELHSPELVQFMRDFINSEKIKAVMHPKLFDTNRRTVEAWLTTYDRKHAQNVREANTYISSKREKICNLFIKSLLPNLMGAIARTKA